MTLRRVVGGGVGLMYVMFRANVVFRDSVVFRYNVVLCLQGGGAQSLRYQVEVALWCSGSVYYVLGSCNRV